MGMIADEIVRLALQEWEFFGRSARSLADAPGDGWFIAGNELDDAYRPYITNYWRAVGLPDYDGATPEPWSAAFICWCFENANAGDAFTPSRKHSRYINRIRVHDGMSPLLRLRRPSRALEPGDLIWNPRGDNPPANHDQAIQRLRDGDFFDSHVDIVVAVRPGECDSVGGNVYPPGQEGGSIVRSTWRLDENGGLADGRKNWVGVVKNGL